ncbi:MarR family winged helix-turn-helix transcriptional regulator [Glaciibacter psychrotolerans]|uniref:DNA-binding MarR family transcriptional regulator n=1 Tax=Glaciibacter psychrotolerans TaxID=670054 RepID=A0A7Z0EFM0_9MICO|nr:MarR family transcriptional regulator [Leifsonia psychrotolerans]NYJ20640.1 DNA-binding MarR family transcriptional regulator [Leifsonia psychrotolerans]
MESDLHQVLGDLVVVNHRLTRVAARAAGGTESPALWRTLSVLRGSGPLRLGALAESSRVSQPTATNLVTTLDELGWVHRRADPTDARASLIEASDAGLAALDAWRDKLIAALMPLFADLGPAEIETLRHAVEIVAARVDPVDVVGAAGGDTVGSVGTGARL